MPAEAAATAACRSKIVREFLTMQGAHGDLLEANEE
jgi:hypothetical protein